MFHLNNCKNTPPSANSYALYQGIPEKTSIIYGQCKVVFIVYWSQPRASHFHHNTGALSGSIWICWSFEEKTTVMQSLDRTKICQICLFYSEFCFGSKTYYKQNAPIRALNTARLPSSFMWLVDAPWHIFIFKVSFLGRMAQLYHLLWLSCTLQQKSATALSTMSLKL